MQIKEINATKLPDIGIKRVAAYARVSSEKGEALHSLSAQISYYNEYISNLGANGELMLTLLAMYAEEEARSASENQKWRIQKMFEEGRPNTGRMLGYITECQERLENEDVVVQLKETRQQAEISLEDLMAEIQGLVHENARKSQDQQKYRAKFNKFVQQIDEQKKRMAVLKAEELKLVGMREKLHRFIETLKNCKDATVFKEQEWNNLVERAVVKTESLDFEFKNGERIKITI